MSKAPTQRRRKLIKPSLQLKLVGAFLGVSGLTLFAQVLLMGLRLNEFANEMPVGGSALATQLPALLGRVLVESILVLIPMTIGFGILITFRTAGPIYRFEQYLGQVARGETVGPCKIRDRDQLQGLCDRINEALEYARQHGRVDTSDEVESASPPEQRAA